MKPKAGAFKVAHIGHTNIPIFQSTSSSTKVCVKQCFYHDADGALGRAPSRIVYNSHTQLKKLTVESYCATWGAALMQLAYDFVEQENAQRGPPSFPIPRLRFVRVALAVADDKERHTFLIEECIDEDTDGEFLKYINNDRSSPLSHPNNLERQQIGEFLAFAQHVQYVKTQKLAFVSDVQGGTSLLSDPQIITAPELSGNLFAGGNIGACFQHFTDDHLCNRFCRYYIPEGLPKAKAGKAPRFGVSLEQMLREAEDEKAAAKAAAMNDDRELTNMSISLTSLGL